MIALPGVQRPNSPRAKARGSRSALACDAPGAIPCPPALTGGESQTRGAKVDWLTVTWQPEPDEAIAYQVYEWFSAWMGGVMGEECNGMFGYEHAVRFYVPLGGTGVNVGRIDYGGKVHGGRVRMEITGAGSSKVKLWARVADVICCLEQAKITRVDLAVDCLNGEFDVEDAVDWYQHGDFNAGGRNPRHSLVGDWLAPKHGRTLEVGRRENGKMLRCYEKGRQLGDQASKWTRFEVEIRNNDRDIPLEVLTSPDSYFVGAYKCLDRLLEAAAERIKTHQKEGEISAAVMSEYCSVSYGKLIDVMRVQGLSATQIIEHISRPGIPKRMERASLFEFINGFPTGPLH